MASITNLVAKLFCVFVVFRAYPIFLEFSVYYLHAFYVWLFAFFVNGKTNLFEFGPL